MLITKNGGYDNTEYNIWFGKLLFDKENTRVSIISSTIVQQNQHEICYNYFRLRSGLLCDFCSIDEQVARDIQLIDSIAEKQAQIFSEECKLFPADVQIQAIYPL